MVNFEKIKEGINQSTLKTIHFLPSKMTEDTSLFYEERECLVLGNAVDCYLLTPELFQDKFYIEELTEKPPPPVMSFIHEIFSYGLEWNEESITLHIDKLNYQANWKLQTKLNYLMSSICIMYYSNLHKAKGKQILTTQEFEIVVTVTTNFLNHPHTSDYFKAEDSESQLLLKGEINGFTFYGTLDRINKDIWNRVIQPFDVKTTGEYTVNFDRVFKRFKYYYQDIVYMELLRQNYPDYTILPFKYLVESVKTPGLPLVYFLDEKSRTKAEEEVFNAIDLLTWHIEYNITDMPKYIYDAKGHLQINLE